MFENQVTEWLKWLLSKYIKDLKTEQVNLGILEGNLKLDNLEIKGDALDDMNLPVYVKHGVLRQLELQVPFTKLWSQPIEVAIEDLYLVCSVQANTVYDKEAEEAKEQAEKKAALDQHELVCRKMKEGEKSNEESSFMERIRNNMQVTIKHIHLRFEGDSELYPGSMYAFGITLEAVKMITTNARWKPKFVQKFPGHLCNKLVDLKNLAMYVDVDTCSLVDLPIPSFCNEMREMIMCSVTRSVATESPSSAADAAAGDGASVCVDAAAPVPLANDCYVLSQLNATLKVTLNKSLLIDASVPRMQVDVALSELSLSMSDDQYHIMMELLDRLNMHMQQMKYVKFRPCGPVKDCPRAWFRYAARVMRHQIHEEHQLINRDYVMEHKRQRDCYIALYKRTLGADWLKPLSVDETAALKKQEEELPCEDIVFFRSLTDKILAKEAENKARRDEFLENKRYTFSDWFWGLFGYKKKTVPTDGSEPKIELTDKQMYEVYDSVSYCQCQHTIKPPPEYALFKTCATIGHLAVTLSHTKVTDTPNMRKRMPFRCSLSHVNVDYEMHPNDMQVAVKMQDLGHDPLVDISF